MIKEIVVISGKGGTGKTSFTASFALLAKDNAIIADCDVDAADMHILLQPDFSSREDFYSGYTATINQDKCIQCGKCYKICRFDAVSTQQNTFTINDMDCEGCGYCARACPENAITLTDALAGELFVSKTRFNNTMVHAALTIAADNSGKLVTRVKKEAHDLAVKNNKELILIDGTPGIGCPVTASLTGADFAVMVTEPTLSGIHDMERVHHLCKQMHIKTGIIINKADLNQQITKKIKHYCKEHDITFISEFDYDEDFTAAMTNKKTIIEEKETTKEQVGAAWDMILEKLKK